VSGRAGRRAKQGQVVIQTSNINHPVLKFILANDFESFFAREIDDRRQHDYPPFTRLIEITLRHTDKKVCRDASQMLAALLRESLPGIRIMGPGEPMIAKIRNQFLMAILIKVLRGKKDLTEVKANILKCIELIGKEKKFRNVRVVADVDPA
jgi:primosomal protein N' (replication factor Y)